ncbi:MAG: hypothetical protein Q8K97_17560 [Pseudohongiella sp.]|nr:hypothetical protein [Pseudohongiella sp.]
MDTTKITPQLRARIECLVASYEQCTAQELYNSAIDFAADYCSVSAAAFLRMWRESDWVGIAREFPEYTPPSASGVPNPEQLQLRYGTCDGQGEHPIYDYMKWLIQASGDLTREGYWQWVYEALLEDLEYENAGPEHTAASH